MVVYPEQRPAARLTVIQREVLLPQQASGLVTVLPEQRVDIHDVIARGLVPGYHVLVDALAFFKLRSPAQLEPLLRVAVDDMVDEVHVLAGKDPERGRRLYAPVRGRIAAIRDGYIVIEQLNEVIDIEAGVRGRVAEVRSGRGAVIEATGAHIQGVWGNGRSAIAVLRLEGNTPLETMVNDSISSKVRNAIVALRRSITWPVLEAAVGLGIAGLIAPSMAYDLTAEAVELQMAILITEAFGPARPNRTVMTLLQELEGTQVSVDAFTPSPWESRRPEIVVNTTAKPGEVPARANLLLNLRPGMSVRVVGEPHTGRLATVINLPNEPVLLDNGLRVACAQVDLGGDERAFVPVTNLEVIGR